MGNKKVILKYFLFLQRTILLKNQNNLKNFEQGKCTKYPSGLTFYFFLGLWFFVNFESKCQMKPFYKKNNQESSTTQLSCYSLFIELIYWYRYKSHRIIFLLISLDVSTKRENESKLFFHLLFSSDRHLQLNQKLCLSLWSGWSRFQNENENVNEE